MSAWKNRLHLEGAKVKAGEAKVVGGNGKGNVGEEESEGQRSERGEPLRRKVTIDDMFSKFQGLYVCANRFTLPIRLLFTKVTVYPDFSAFHSSVVLRAKISNFHLDMYTTYVGLTG